jgi:hypothetical protein
MTGGDRDRPRLPGAAPSRSETSDGGYATGATPSAPLETRRA